MGLKDLDIKLEYETLCDDLVDEFYIPVLNETITYQRAVGFFSSTVLLQISRGLCSLIKKNGKMKLLISPKLDAKDYEAIEKGYDIRKQLEDKIVNSFDEFVDFDQRDDRYGMLSYLISVGLLEIKIVALEEKNDKAMYHEKLGLMFDYNDDIVCFTGSMNDSSTAIGYNYESIDVYCSWKSDDNYDRCILKKMRFERMWNGNEKGLVTISFPEVIKQKLLKYQNDKIDYSKLDEIYIEKIKAKRLIKEKKTPNLNSIDGLRDYQIKAIDNWEKCNYRGIFDMATGTGKTFTGCGAIVRLYESKKRLFVVICCPYVHLVDQWYDEVKSFNIEAIKCYGSVDYKLSLQRAVKEFKYEDTDFVCAIVVNRTFQSEQFQNLIKENLNDTLLIVDEAHNFGSYKLKECLKIDYPYRLALSATLERYGDKEGTKALFDFFGEKCFTFSLEEAIIQHKLTKYYYYPIIVTLDEEELDEYKNLTIQIGKKYAANANEDEIKKLLIKRTRLIAGAKNKIKVLEDVIKSHKNDYNMLIYCGAVKYGEYGYSDSSSEVKQINTVLELLNKKLNIKSLKFTSEEKPNERKEIISAFKDNIIQALVAIKCLDEGMNIPAIKTAFILASSTNPKEYIQRRGRVLRNSPGKDFAEIYDFITLPFDLTTASQKSYDSIKSYLGLVKREIVRLEDFANISIRPSECNRLLDEIKSAYRLDKIVIDEEKCIYE